MANLVKWITSEVNESDIEAVVIGEMGWGDYGDDPEHDRVAKEHQGKILNWNEAKEFLNYEFDDGFGAPECNAVYVWTNNKILLISQYDGATNLYSIPRNPIECEPHMPGG